MLQTRGLAAMHMHNLPAWAFDGLVPKNRPVYNRLLFNSVAID